MSKARQYVILATLGAIVVYAVGQFAHPSGQSRETTRLTDSLAVSRPAFDSTVRELVRVETVTVARATGFAQAATWTKVRADSLRRLSEALAGLAAASASADDWHAAFVVSRQEADSLRVAASAFEHAFGAEREARLEADARADAERARRQAVERLNVRLASDLRHARDCKLLGVPCPSRTATGLVVAVVTWVLATR